MARVVLVTAAHTFMGELDLSTAGGAPLRLLDALNNPKRLAAASTGSRR
jgi:hypothetical protein